MMSAKFRALHPALTPIGKGEFTAQGIERGGVGVGVVVGLARREVGAIWPGGTRGRKRAGEWFLYGSHMRCYHIIIYMLIGCLPIDYSNDLVENVYNFIRMNGGYPDLGSPP